MSGARRGTPEALELNLMRRKVRVLACELLKPDDLGAFSGRRAGASPDARRPHTRSHGMAHLIVQEAQLQHETSVGNCESPG